MIDRRYVEYDLFSSVMCIGERVKKGTFKPCVRTIPFSTVTGSLRDILGISDVIAAGKLDPNYLRHIDRFRHMHVYSPRYVFEDVAKVPLRIEFLSEVRGKVYVLLNSETIRLHAEKYKEFDITMGAFKSKGFGRCHLRFVRAVENPRRVTGKLQTRIPENHLADFGITEVTKPIYGYLFEPEGIISGKYVRSLFDGSIVNGYEFLCQEDA